MNPNDELMRRLAAANPVTSEQVRGRATSPDARQVYRRIVSEDDPAESKRGVSRKTWGRSLGRIAAASLVLVILIVAPSLLEGDSGSAAAHALDAAADVAAAQPFIPSVAAYVYAKSMTAAPVTSLGADGKPWTVIVRSTQEEWVAPNGSGRVKTGPTRFSFLGQRDRDSWLAAGSPKVGNKATDRSFGVGNLGYEDVAALPTDVHDLAALLRVRAQIADDPDVQMLIIIGNLLRRTDAPPQLRASLYRVAAAIPDVELLGRVTDEAGRPGLAVGITSDATGWLERTELIFDPATSRLLDERTELLERVGWIDADPPVVIAYSAYVAAGTVDSTSERP
jgi:hypothetical protein